MPSHCSLGTKKNSKGYKETWIGYNSMFKFLDTGKR